MWQQVLVSLWVCCCRVLSFCELGRLVSASGAMAGVAGSSICFAYLACCRLCRFVSVTFATSRRVGANAYGLLCVARTFLWVVPFSGRTSGRLLLAAEFRGMWYCELHPLCCLLAFCARVWRCLG